MVRIDIEKYCKVKNEILNFIEQQKQYYSPEEYKFMKFIITTNGIINYNAPIITNLTQILSKFDVIKDKTDCYKVFFIRRQLL